MALVPEDRRFPEQALQRVGRGPCRTLVFVEEASLHFGDGFVAKPLHDKDPFPVSLLNLNTVFQGQQTVRLGHQTVDPNTTQSTGSRSLTAGLEKAGHLKPLIQANVHAESVPLRFGLRIADLMDRMDEMDDMDKANRSPVDSQSEIRNPRSTEDLIGLLQLAPHPEGGFYRETYRSSEMIGQSALPPGFSGARPCSTAIFYLLPEGSRSLLHRLKSDELWHFYLGGAVHLSCIEPNGEVRQFVLGPLLEQGHRLQQPVPSGSWMGAYPLPGSGYALLGCTVAPGFDFAELEMGDRAELIRSFPHAQDLIQRLT
jgi:uncharacterized protein